MTKREAEAHFRAFVLPGVRAHYELDGVPDYPARREAWNNMVDAFNRTGDVTDRQAKTWSHPRCNIEPWRTR